MKKEELNLKKPKKLRKVGDILLEMEPLLFELVEKHELQKGELLVLFSVWVDIHYPGAIEPYEDGTNPIFYYGHKDFLKNK